MPRQKPGRSVQAVQTDPRLIAAVERRFGHLVLDLAASAENTQAPYYFDEDDDSLRDECDWNAAPVGNRWLNPPFADIAPWAAKCWAYGRPGNKTFLHVPASTGANWFRDYVDGKALVMLLNGRVTYVGHTTCYPKDCIVAVYGMEPGYEVWDWLKKAA